MSARIALQGQFVESLSQGAYAHANEAAVRLQLAFARTAHADTTLLPFQVGPAAHEARGQVLQLRQFHLQLALVATGTLREDIEDEPVPVEHAPAGQLFEVAFLARAERVVEQHHLRLQFLGFDANFFGLAGAHEKLRVGTCAVTGDRAQHRSPGGFRQGRKFPEVFGVDWAVDAEANQQGTLAATRTFKQAGAPCPGRASRWNQSATGMSSGTSSLPSPEGRRTLRAGTTVEIACL